MGYRGAQDLSEMVKEGSVKGIEGYMQKQAALLCAKFENGFPVRSEVALDSFGDFIS